MIATPMSPMLGTTADPAATDPVFAALRKTEFARLDAGGHAYLDYTGAALHGASQVAAQQRRLLTEVLGNPHSENPAARESTSRMERARHRVLTFFDADPEIYDVVFTANASAALQRVGESFPWRPGSRLVLTADNHNSVNGLRCYAERSGAAVHYVPLHPTLRALDPSPWLERGRSAGPDLFAFPAQSNFSGVQHPLHWIGAAESAGYHVLLDAAAYVPAGRLSLARVQPSFVCVSFYKMFGAPTGVGALIARRDALSILRRPWFAGGTVDWVSTQHREHGLRQDVHAFEDGTPNYLAFDGVCDGLDFLERIGMDRIRAHVASLTRLLISRLLALSHHNRQPVVVLHGPATPERRGGTVSFSVRDDAGRVAPFGDVVQRAAAHRVSVRGGCFCNPGCAETAFRLPANRARECRVSLSAPFDIDRFAACVGGPVGAVRASVGVPTQPADIERLVDVIAQYRT